ncbi:MAG: DapH/DapD/GlmU-related protein [Promethearchaeota archaeon]
MSVPNTMRVGPFASTVLVKKRYIVFYLFLMWASMIPVLIEFYFYWQFLWDYIRPVHFFIYLPLFCILAYVTIVFSAIFFAKILLVIINKIHEPREGVFLRDVSDRDYRYWSIRNTIKRWPTWLSHKFPFPFLDNICFKAFNVKTRFSNSLFEGWVDTEFIEFGKNVVVGQGAIIQSAVIIGNHFIIRKTIIEENVRIGAHTIIMPGTHIGKNCILNTWSSTMVGQELEAGWIYNGGPAKKFKKNRFFEDGLQDKIMSKGGNVEDLIEKYDIQYVKRHDERSSFKDKLLRKKDKKEEEKRRWEKGVK